MAPSRTRDVAPFILFALFVVVLLLTLLAGVKVYTALVSAEDAIKDERFGVGMLANSVRAADTYDAISAGQGPEGPMLVMTEGSAATPVETRIYLTEGRLVQEYAIAGSHLSPGDALTIMETSTFSFTFDSGLLTIITDEGPVDVALRCSEVSL